MFYRLFLSPENHAFLCFFLLSEEITLSEALHLARVRPPLNGSNLDWKEKKRRRIEKKRGFPTLIPPQQKQSAVAPHPFACRSKPQAKYNIRKSLCYFCRAGFLGGGDMMYFYLIQKTRAREGRDTGSGTEETRDPELEKRTCTENDMKRNSKKAE